MQRLNRFLVRNSSFRSFTAVVFAVLDLEKMDIRWSGSGLPEPILLPKKGKARYLEMERYPLPPGASHRSAYIESSCKLSLGDTIVFVTDGVIEARPVDGSGNDFGYEGLLAFLSTCRRSDPRVLLDALAARLKEHRGTEEFEDDITAVAVRIGGKK